MIPGIPAATPTARTAAGCQLKRMPAATCDKYTLERHQQEDRAVAGRTSG